jgi:hypothetical protein
MEVLSNFGLGGQIMGAKVYSGSIVWLGVWETPEGLSINGFHVWDRYGEWVGVYPTHSKAVFHSRIS